MEPNQQQLDPSVVALTKAIGQSESGGNYNAKGKSGESGAYQFMPSTWKEWAGKYIGDPNAPLTRENQDKVAYSRIYEWGKQGYKPAQIASMWNSGKPDWEGNVGVNSMGVAYDTPAYVKRVAENYQKFIGGTANTARASTDEPQIEEPNKPSVGGFLGNVVESGANFLGGIGNAIAHPIDTLANIANLGAGALEQGAQAVFNATGLNKYQKGGPIDTPESRMAANVGEFYKDRYGGVSNIGKTLYEDPVGAAADASLLLTGGGAALGKLGQAGKVGGTLSKAGSAIDPLQAAARAGGAVVRGTGKIAGEGLGQTTGVGYEPIKEAFTKGTEPEFTAAMRGRISERQLGKNAGAALETFKQQTRNQFVSSKSSLGSIAPEAGGPNNIAQDAIKIMDEYKIGVKEGEPVFEGSRVLQNAQSEVKEAIQMIRERLSNPENITPENLDILKQDLGDLIPREGQGRVIVTRLKNSVDSFLKKNVEGYADMEAAYSAAKDFQRELKSISLGTNANGDTVIRKLTTALKKNNEFRAPLIDKLDELTGSNLRGQVAGSQLSSFTPRGLTANLLEKGGIVGAFLHPGFIPALALSSPRVVGEFVRALGVPASKAAQYLRTLQTLKASGLLNASQRVNQAISSPSSSPR